MVKMFDQPTEQPVRLMLVWIGGQLCWIADTESESISVGTTIYDRCMKEHLASRGIERQSWSHYLKQAEEAWRRQCEAEERLQADLAFWRTVPGVQIVPQRKQEP